MNDHKLQKRQGKYQWDDWFQLDRFDLVSGEHYDVSQSAMVQQIRNAATARRLKVSITDTGGGISVEVRER